MDEFNKHVGKRIAQLRKERRLTREKLAEIAETSDKYLYEVEIGKKGLSAYKMTRVAQALDVSMDYLSRGIKNVGQFETIETLLSGYDESGLKCIEELIRTLNANFLPKKKE